MDPMLFVRFMSLLTAAVIAMRCKARVRLAQARIRASAPVAPSRQLRRLE
jgi:hypothetical protein